MKKVVISGGPSTGKSTTFEALKERYPEAYFVPEAAERVIARELQWQKEDRFHLPVTPTSSYREFMPKVIAESKQLEYDIPVDTELAFLDRCFIDNIGYAWHNDLLDTPPIRDLKNHIKAARYTVAFFCDWLGKFENTQIRRETAEQGYEIHQALETAYHAADIEVVHLPAVSVEERLIIIEDTLARM